HERISSAFQRSLNRSPTQSELEQAIDYLQSTKAELKSDEKAWSSLCQALLVTNEFRYVD
ncbi:MAG: hypothetical protein HQ518_06945, partial [Rhodopirellula sp.]|nr:hypothetical protein [Rhodopirellula sp.]